MGCTIMTRFWGIFLVSLGVSLLAGRSSSQRILLLLKEPATKFVLGIIILLIGAVSVSLCTTLSLHLCGVITVLGWLSLLKGASFIIMPDNISKFWSIFERDTILYRFSLILSVLIGLFLMWKGFF